MEICFATFVICQEWDQRNDLRVSEVEPAEFNFSTDFTRVDIFNSFTLIWATSRFALLWFEQQEWEWPQESHSHRIIKPSSLASDTQASMSPRDVPLNDFTSMVQPARKHLKGPILDLNNVTFTFSLLFLFSWQWQTQRWWIEPFEWSAPVSKNDPWLTETRFFFQLTVSLFLLRRASRV